MNFPNLNNQNHHVTSPPTPRYNCFAWAAEEDNRFWDPNGGWWPAGIPRDLSINAFVQAYSTVGYVQCADGTHDPGVEKIAIYAKNVPGFGQQPTHAARQLPNGRWTSKLGKNVDIEHTTLEAIADGTYGSVVLFMSRPLGAAAP